MNFPTTIYDDIVAAAAAKHDVPADWIKAFIGTESSFDPNIADRWEPKVKEYAYGPMQVLLSTARGLGFNGTGAQLREARTNIDIGAADIAQLRLKTGDDFPSTYSAYNSGSPDRWLTSETVHANVERAIEWLSAFAPAPDMAATIVTVFGFGAALWLLQRRRKQA